VARHSIPANLEVLIEDLQNACFAFEGHSLQGSDQELADAEAWFWRARKDLINGIETAIKKGNDHV